jgi:hypothetical protein
MATQLGVCRNSECPNGASGVTVELYPGPGEYCPECGEKLDATTAAPPAPFGGKTALEALEQFAADEPTPKTKGRNKRPVIASLAVVGAAVIAIVALHPSAIGHPGNAVRICAGSTTQRLASALISGYSSKSFTPATQLALVKSSPCEVHFSASEGKAAADAIAHDAVVAIVNPANPVTHLDQETIRKIYHGDITDWSQLGGRPGRIVPMIAVDGTDEATEVSTMLMQGMNPAPDVQRLQNSRQITKAVVSADNLRAIGLVPFSESDPAKILTLGTIAPNPLSISDGRYPLSLDITVNADSTARAQATAFTQYVRSDDAQAVVTRSGLVPKRGI